MLLKLGKSNYNTTAIRQSTELEEKIVRRNKRSWFNVSEVPYLPNPVFLFEMGQLADTNETRSAAFRKDFQTYLGLDTILPLLPHHKPGRSWDTENQRKKDEKKIDICDERWKPVRRDLLKLARQGSEWIRGVFLDSRDIHVSSRPYLEELLLTWMHDPCANDTEIIRYKGPTMQYMGV
jgi:hypothetical protein